MEKLLTKFRIVITFHDKRIKLRVIVNSYLEGHIETEV